MLPFRSDRDTFHIVTIGVVSTGPSFTFTGPGEHRYDCSFHPNDMSGLVVVSERWRPRHTEALHRSSAPLHSGQSRASRSWPPWRLR
jgi:hypothetical protein